MSEQLIQTPCAFGDNGNFLLERELGSGGMGGVYMGRDKMLDRPVAVKVMQKEFGADVEFVEKFKREAQSAAKLIHPNIAQVYSYGICDGMPYIAMELAAGGSLYSIMNVNPGKADVARVIKICQQVAQALQCASDQGFVHGDVKPENILLDSNGNAKLVDFGLAGMQKDTDEIWGTPYYISPEKVKKESVDFRTDMYSLGGTLYHALTGVAPFEGTDSIAVVKRRFEGVPRNPSEIRPELTPAIDDLVMKMLAFNKEDRYPSFEALLDAFKSVLTTGLTASLPKPTTAAPAKKPVVAGGRRMMTVRGRRAAMMKRPGAAIKKSLEGGEGDLGSSAKPASGEEDEEEEGSIGLKVVGVVVGSILLIGGVIGGLVWYQVADKKARAAEEQAQIVTGIEKARGAIAETVDKAAKFADEFDAFAARAAEECQVPTDKLKAMLPEDQGALLKPGPSKELLDAIASTNEAQKAVASSPTNATPAEVTATTNATAVSTAAPGTGALKLPHFRPPTEDEMDPASPEGEKYLQDKKAWEAEQLNKLKESPKKREETASSSDSATKPEEKKGVEVTAEVVIAMNELWERAYGCQACAIRIRQSVRALLQQGDEALELKAETRENMDKLADLSRTLVDMFEQIKASKDVETVRKGITYIKSRGGKTVEQTVKRLRREKLEAERKAKKEADEAAEKARLEKLEAEKKAKIESEIASARSSFETIVTRGDIRQLDWTKALRTLNALKDAMTTAEGQLACDLEIRKVNDMKNVQDLFIKNIKGHAFKGKLAKHKVFDANEKEIVLVKPDGKTKQKILWRSFYKEYPGNLNELINGYVVHSRGPNSKVKLSLREWADALTGAALTMQLVCGEVNGAMERAEAIVKEAVKQFPDYEKTAHEIFPEIKFDAATEE